MKIFLVVILMLFSALSAQGSTINTCHKDILGGGSDVFPWGKEEPFPWKTIQGIWRVHNNPDMLFQFRVNNPNKKNRRLLVQVFSRENCVEPLYKVPGVFSETQKDVLNFQIDDKLMKLAWFKATDLNMAPDQCGKHVMAASIIASADAKNFVPMGGRVDVELPPDQEEEDSTTENFFLKKLSNSLEIYCKRKI